MLTFKFTAVAPDLGITADSPVESWPINSTVADALRPLITHLDTLDPLPNNGALDVKTTIVVPVKVRWWIFSWTRNLPIDVTLKVTLND